MNSSLEEYPPLFRTPSLVSYKDPHSPISSPAFKDLPLLKSLDIFSDNSPISPSTRLLDSIKFENFSQEIKEK